MKSLRIHVVLGCFSLLIIIATSCKNKSVEPPVPQPASVVVGDKTYPTVTIGNQVWTTVNYAGPGGMAHSSDAQKAVYGRYYTYVEAKAIPLPAGWRLPTEQDGRVLLQSQGIVLGMDQSTQSATVKSLLSTTHWRTTPGTNTTGFNAYPTGYISQNQPPQDGDIAEFWLADGVSMSIQESTNGRHRLRFYGNADDPSVRYTIRFVRDK